MDDKAIYDSWAFPERRALSGAGLGEGQKRCADSGRAETFLGNCQDTSDTEEGGKDREVGVMCFLMVLEAEGLAGLTKQRKLFVWLVDFKQSLKLLVNKGNPGVSK